MSDNKLKAWAKERNREMRAKRILEDYPPGTIMTTEDDANYSTVGPVHVENAGQPPGLEDLQAEALERHSAKAKLKAAIRKVAKSKRRPKDEGRELDLEPSVTEGGTRE